MCFVEFRNIRLFVLTKIVEVGDPFLVLNAWSVKGDAVQRRRKKEMLLV